MWLVYGAFKNAEIVTASIAAESTEVSLLILMFISPYCVARAAEILHDRAVREICADESGRVFQRLKVVSSQSTVRIQLNIFEVQSGTHTGLQCIKNAGTKTRRASFVERSTHEA